MMSFPNIYKNGLIVILTLISGLLIADRRFPFLRLTTLELLVLPFSGFNFFEL